MKLPAVELQGIFSVEYDFILSSLANPAAALYATIKDKAATALAKHFQGLVAELHPRRLPVQAVSFDSSLDRDLGLDSLARVEVFKQAGPCIKKTGLIHPFYMTSY